MKSGTEFKDGAAQSAAPMAARGRYPAGGFYYLDFDMGGYMACASALMPADPSAAMVKQQMATLFAGAAPIVSAGFKEGERVKWSVIIPGDLIAKWGQFAMMMQMQQMQQQQMGAPAPVAP